MRRISRRPGSGRGRNSCGGDFSHGMWRDGMRKYFGWLMLVALLVCANLAEGADSPLLLQQPTISKSEVVFVYGGYLWSVPREGGEARQLTTGGHETHPAFSPDGKWLAFTGEYDGNADVYVMAAESGAPKRLTWHPGADVVVGWTPDGKKILFNSGRESYADFGRLYTVAAEGGAPEALPMWRAEVGSYSPDASRLAYVPNLKWQAGGESDP